MRRLVLAILLAIFCAAAAPATAGPWIKAETPHFIIYSDGSPAAVRRYARMLEDYDGALRTFHGRRADEPPGARFQLFLVASEADFRRVFPEARQGIEGMYSAGPEDTFAVAVRSPRGWLTPLTGDHTVFHEYTHHFMHQHLPGGYPAWYVEGYAEYFAPTILGRTITVGAIDAGRAFELSHESWIPVGDLLTRPAEAIPAKRLSAFYGEAWLLTHYIMDDPGRRAALARYLTAVRAGASPSSAWQGAFGESPQATEKTLRAYLAGQKRGVLIRRSWRAPAVTVSELTPGQGAILLENQFLKRQTALAPAAAVIAPIARAAAGWPDDPFVERALARVKLALGERIAGEAILKTLIAADPKDAESLRLLADSTVKGAPAEPTARRAAYDRARALLAQAEKADPADLAASQTRSGEVRVEQAAQVGRGNPDNQP